MNFDFDRYVVVDQLKNNVIACFDTRHEAINFLLSLPKQIYLDRKGIDRYRFVLSLDKFETLTKKESNYDLK